MIVYDGWDIHSLAASVGFDQTKSADLALEYFLLRLIESLNGRKRGSEVACQSNKFRKICDHYQMTFSIPDQETDPSFWSRLDKLLVFFHAHNLLEFDCFQREVCPWMIADQAAFDDAFPDDFSTGKRVAALFLLLKFVAEQAGVDNISSIDPQQFFDTTPGVREAWMRITTLSCQEFILCWRAVFSYKHTSIPVKINGQIASAISAYRGKKVPMQKLLTDFSDIKKHRSQLEKGVNHWADLQKKIKKNPVESGVTIDETLFDLAAWNLKEEKASKVIRSVFYNKSRNVSAFECGFLYEIFMRSLRSDDKILIVNPSPDYILRYVSDKYFSHDKTYFAVADDTIAFLYNQEFSTQNVMPFSKIHKLVGISRVLIMSRDWPVDKMEALMSCLKTCQDFAQIYATLPNAMFDSEPEKWKKYLRETTCLIRNVMLLPTGVTTKNANRKKVLVRLEKYSAAVEHNPDIYFSTAVLGPDQRLYFTPTSRVVTASDFFNSGLTIRSLYQRAALIDIGPPKKERRKPAERYVFSKEIIIRYTILKNRKNRYAGKAYYCSILDTHKRGKPLTETIEKGLRSHTEQGVLTRLEEVPFDDRVESVIIEDILQAYAGEKSTLSLKTVWFCLRSMLLRKRRYDDSIAKSLFCGESQELSNLCPSAAFEADFTNAMESIFGQAADDILLKYWEQLSLILDSAVEGKYLKVNPLERLLREMSTRATRAQREVRNALSKKTFTHEEEEKILAYICGETRKSYGPRHAKRYEVDSVCLAGAICLYTGMEFREVCALTWRDLQCTELDTYQFAITKLAPSGKTAGSDLSKQAWKAFRLLPLVPELSEMLIARKNYLLAVCHLSEKELNGTPIILRADPAGTQAQPLKLEGCSPQTLARKCKKVIDVAEIQSQILLLPDEINPLESDLAKYQGNIFRTNFKYRANHTCGLTRGEINYILGISPPDTFSRHYCDYTNDFIQLAMAHKLQRWTASFQSLGKPDCKVSAKLLQWEGHHMAAYGPFGGGCACADLIIETDPAICEGTLMCTIESDFGYYGSVIQYGEEVGKDENSRD